MIGIPDAAGVATFTPNEPTARPRRVVSREQEVRGWAMARLVGGGIASSPRMRNSSNADVATKSDYYPTAPVSPPRHFRRIFSPMPSQTLIPRSNGRLNYKARAPRGHRFADFHSRTPPWQPIRKRRKRAPNPPRRAITCRLIRRSQRVDLRTRGPPGRPATLLLCAASWDPHAPETTNQIRGSHILPGRAGCIPSEGNSRLFYEVEG